ncbi:hypothetical protein KIW84_030802 [Lathyrus oleraceus]|uniref:Reverse transcriptase zinc-binding domain-containing protein n=1 Tax=Pisum sativum TaxID=3888 RepID=A0A9D5AZG2_PEA|nr:hypothetical protein KIW84_030802 [Pisum sativum]
MLSRICKMLRLLEGVVSLRGREDVAVWLMELCGGYSTKSGYEAMAEGYVTDVHVDGLIPSCNILWSLKIPFRIKAFWWRSFLNILPTKDQLSRRVSESKYLDFDKLNTMAKSYTLLGSKVLSDVHVVSKLRDVGAIILGKTSPSKWYGVPKVDLQL